MKMEILDAEECSRAREGGADGVDAERKMRSSVRSMLLAFARAGVFRQGGTLVGPGAYALFQGDLGRAL